MSAPARVGDGGAARRAAPARPRAVPARPRAVPARPRAVPPARPHPVKRQHPKSTGWTRPRLVASRAPQAVVRTGPRRAPFVLLVAGLLIGGMCSLLALNTAAAAEELRRNALSQSNADLVDDVQQVQAELAARQAPAALASDAAKLGMVPAGNPAFLSIQPDGSVKVLGEPQPATAPAPLRPNPPKKPAKKAVKKATKPAKKATKPATHPTTAPAAR
jgi:hypothetical protein